MKRRKVIGQATAVAYADAVCQPGTILDKFVMSDGTYNRKSHDGYIKEIETIIATDASLNKKWRSRMDDLKHYFESCFQEPKNPTSKFPILTQRFAEDR